MNKKQLVAKISSTLGQSKADAERTFDSITTIILDALKNDDTVKIAGFGTYKVAKRKARVGRNPRTGESIQIAASKTGSFTISILRCENTHHNFAVPYKSYANKSGL